MLQALAGKSRPPGRAAEQEAARSHVAAGPREVADALEAEHRVIDIERNHLHAVVRIRRRGGDPRAVRAAFVDAFLENLALLVLAVIRQLIRVLRGVELAERRVDADLAEHAFHAECSGFVRHDRHDARANALDRKSTRLNSSHSSISYAVFCLKKKTNKSHKTI